MREGPEVTYGDLLEKFSLKKADQLVRNFNDLQQTADRSK